MQFSAVFVAAAAFAGLSSAQLPNIPNVLAGASSAVAGAVAGASSLGAEGVAAASSAGAAGLGAASSLATAGIAAGSSLGAAGLAGFTSVIGVATSEVVQAFTDATATHTTTFASVVSQVTVIPANSTSSHGGAAQAMITPAAAMAAAGLAGIALIL